MVGRYGPDQLGVACVILAVVLKLVSSITRFGILGFLAYIILVFALFRFLSRDMVKRRRENDKFIRYWWPLRRKLLLRVEKIKSRRQYKFFSCPSCGNQLRVPRGKGKIKITCPKCGERFERKT
jgi:hypothetical protein